MCLQVKFALDEDHEKVWERRAARDIPADVKERPYELAEYFLNTDADDMEYEVSRCRPLLDADFFKYVPPNCPCRCTLQPSDRVDFALLQRLRSTVMHFQCTC